MDNSNNNNSNSMNPSSKNKENQRNLDSQPNSDNHKPGNMRPDSAMNEIPIVDELKSERKNNNEEE